VKRVVIRKRLLLRLSTALIFGLACLSQAHAGLTFNVVTDWKAGAVAEVVIDNTTNESIKDWTLTFSLDESVTQVWNGTLVSKQGSDVVIAARPYNRVIAPGDSVSVGMIIQPGNIVNGPTDMRINSRTLSGPDSTDTPKTPCTRSTCTRSTCTRSTCARSTRSTRSTCATATCACARSTYTRSRGADDANNR